MATIIAQLPPATRKGKEEKYPWAEWLDGQARLLTKGEDFDCSITSFRPLAHVAARRHGKEIETRTMSDSVVALQCRSAA